MDRRRCSYGGWVSRQRSPGVSTLRGMCYRKPGPRCSPHAKRRLALAYADYNAAARIAGAAGAGDQDRRAAEDARRVLGTAYQEYQLTPVYFEELQDRIGSSRDAQERGALARQLERARARRDEQMRQFCVAFPGEGPRPVREQVEQELWERASAAKAVKERIARQARESGQLTPQMMVESHEAYDEYRNATNAAKQIKRSLMSPGDRDRYDQAQAVKAEQFRRPFWQSPDFTQPPPLDTRMDEQERQAWSRALEPDGAVFVDLETTTADPNTGHIIEAAFVREDGTRLHQFYGVPATHEKWNGTGPQHVHHISPEDVRGQDVLMGDAAETARMQAFIGDRVVVAHNAKFEKRWLSANGVRARYADTKKVFARVVEKDRAEGVARTSDTTMGDLTRWAGVPYEGAHRAINDTLMMRAAFERLRPYAAQHVREDEQAPYGPRPHPGRHAHATGTP